MSFFSWLNAKCLNLRIITDPWRIIRGTVNTFRIEFSKAKWMAPPIDPFDPQIIFDPGYFEMRGNYYYPSRYGYFILEEITYNNLGEKQSGFSHYYKIYSCNVTLIPEPATFLLLGLGCLFIDSKRRLR